LILSNVVVDYGRTIHWIWSLLFNSNIVLLVYIFDKFYVQLCFVIMANVTKCIVHVNCLVVRIIYHNISTTMLFYQKCYIHSTSSLISRLTTMLTNYCIWCVYWWL